MQGNEERIHSCLQVFFRYDEDKKADYVFITINFTIKQVDTLEQRFELPILLCQLVLNGSS